MPKVTIRFQQLLDAQRFYEILNNPNFIFFPSKPKSLADEKKWLAGNAKRRLQNTEWNYAILLDGQTVGAVGIKINSQRKFIGEIGYFLEEKHWGKGITAAAVKLAEDEGFKKLNLTRIEIVMDPENKASEKVAIKCGYEREGLMKKSLLGTDNQKKDALLYAKTL